MKHKCCIIVLHAISFLNPTSTFTTIPVNKVVARLWEIMLPQLSYNNIFSVNDTQTLEYLFDTEMNQSTLFQSFKTVQYYLSLSYDKMCNRQCTDYFEGSRGTNKNSLFDNIIC